MKNPPLLTLCLAASLGLAGCEREPDEATGEGGQNKPPTQAGLASHARMLKVLGEHATDARNNHPHLSDKEARRLRGKLEKLPSETSETTSVRTLRLHWDLGTAELNLGNIERGIEHLTKAHEGLQRLDPAKRPPPGLATEWTYRLAIAHMRLGETQNCCLRNTPDSCLLPIQGGGIHADQEASKRAIAYFKQVLQQAPRNSPGYFKARWLVNVMYMTIGGYPDQVPGEYLFEPARFDSDDEFPRFKNIANALGVDTFSLVGGAIVDDFTGDGYLDIVTSTYDPNEEMRFFRNDQDGTFTDRTEEANLVGLTAGFNLVHADYDNDGDLDILMLRGGWMGEAGRIPNSLLRNNGEGRFTDVTFSAGLGEVHYPTQTAAWADYDKDGDVDLYIGNEALTKTEYAPGQLFRNNGDGSFTDVAEEAGVQNLGFTKGVTWGDYDGDGFPDLYVSNLRSPNRLYHNNGDGTFTDVAPSQSVTGPSRSFPVWFWDFNNDGALDLFVPNYDGGLAAYAASRLGFETPGDPAHLYQGDGRGGFREVANDLRLTDLTLPMGANFGDLDNDGYLDFYLGTGYPDYEALMPNAMYRNQGGKSFADVTSAGGFGHLQKGHAVVFADLDNDGDQDVFEQIGGFYAGDKAYDALFENPGFGNHWITVKLIGTRSNRAAIGARIHVRVIENGRARSIYKHVNSGGSFGANPLRQTIGLGKASRIERLEIYWPTTGKTQAFRDVPTGQVLEITEGKQDYRVLNLKSFELAPLSTDD